MKSLVGPGPLGKALAREPAEVRTTQLEREPAVRAWQGLAAGPAPRRVELLRRRPKSVVYRLPGVGREGSDVIAKQCLWQIARNESAVYETLGGLPCTQLAYYGFVADPTRESGWLFVEDAHGETWNPADDEQRRLAARWLASLHRASSRSTQAARLPERGTAWFRGHLRNALRWIPEGFANPALAPESRPVLDRMLALLAAVESAWPAIEAACASLPRALVHGDFAERNVRVRRRAGEPQLLAFDWEVAGWGLTAVDLPNVDLHAYADALGSDGAQLDLGELERLAQIGGLLRGGIAAVSWASEALATFWPDGALLQLRVYQRRIEEALAALGLPCAGGTS